MVSPKRLNGLDALLGTPVFVYGTLKNGYSNHRLLRHAVPMGPALTETEYGMIYAGFPVLIEGAGRMGRVTGELYQVDSPILSSLDALEGVPHMYYRHTVNVQRALSEGPDVLPAFIYFGNEDFWLGRRSHPDWVLPDGSNLLTWKPRRVSCQSDQQAE